jgi:hypothetical protein
MKWKNKKTGWIATTIDYCDTPHMIDEYINELWVTIIHESTTTSFKTPIKFVLDDEQWQPIPDERWLEFRFTMREFMEALGIIENSETFLALKAMADKSLADHINKIYK